MIEAIGSWVVALPSEFLSDSYLKYLAWALSDRAPLVRLAAVKALKELYSNRWALRSGVWVLFFHAFLP